MTKSELIDKYLSFYYYFTSYEAFSDYLSVSLAEAKQMINLGRKYHNEQAEGLK